MSCGVNRLLVWNRQLLARLSLTSAVPLIPFPVPACLPACPLPGQPALPALCTTSKPGTVRRAAMVKPFPASRRSSQHWDGLCTRATSKTPAETPRLCVNHTAAQPHHAHNHEGWTAAQDWFPVCSIAAWRGCLGQWACPREETVKPNAKARSLSVCGWAVQGHWFTTLAGPLRGWRVTQSTCTIGQPGLCTFTQCPSLSSPQPWDQPTAKNYTLHYQRPGNWPSNVNTQNNLPNTLTAYCHSLYCYEHQADTVRQNTSSLCAANVLLIHSMIERVIHETQYNCEDEK